MDPYQEYDSEERHHHPFHHHHHHGHAPPPPPPSEDPYYGGPPGEGFPGPPPPGEGFTHEVHHAHQRYDQPDRPSAQYSYNDPDRPSAQYSYDDPDRYAPAPDRYAVGDPYSTEQKESDEPAIAQVLQGQLVKIFCKGNSNFNLAVGGNGVVMVPASSDDEAQQWVKDSSFGMRVKDNYGFPAFSLVNKATMKVLKHAKEKGQQVLLTDYSPDMRDDDILWTESQDFGDGFKTLRSASDTLLNLTVFEGQKKIRNGSALVLDTWHKADHQLWTVSPL